MLGKVIPILSSELPILYGTLTNFNEQQQNIMGIQYEILNLQIIRSKFKGIAIWGEKSIVNLP